MRQPQLFDSEIFRNYLLFAFKCVETGKITTFEAFGNERIDADRLRAFCKRYTIIGFNYDQFDRLILAAALAGKPIKIIKEIANAIIVGREKAWPIARRYGLDLPKFDTVDLIEVAPGQASLKIYNGRLHGKRMQDLPFDPEHVLTEEEADIVRDYCVNDLDSTGLLASSLEEQLKLRDEMSDEYDIDLRSKSDAQIAEAVIVHRLHELTGEKPERPKIAPGTKYRYETPTFLRFRTKALRDVLRMVEESDFEVSEGGKVLMPPSLSNATIKIGNGVYRMGIGGLHSSETSVCHVADENFVLCDRDVASYYPAIILNLGLFPPHLGKEFLAVYRKIVKQRLEAKSAAKEAKKSGDKGAEKHWNTVANSLKITVNGSFGKLGSKWSALYAPHLMVQVTITGQLSLLLLIEAFEERGIEIISANTDGVVIKCPTDRQDEMLEIVKWWEKETGFETEETRYKAIYMQNVNNYIAVKEDG